VLFITGGQEIFAGNPTSSTHIFELMPLLISATYILLFFGLYAMNTAKMSGSWPARLQVINGDGDNPSGSLIKEKAGSPEPVHEFVPKFTSSEFWAPDVWAIVQMMSEAIN
jgi:hypothetical protein